MPELPEVEITRSGLRSLLVGQQVAGVIVRERRLRWPVAPGLDARLRGQSVQALGRRGKYLLIELDQGTLLIHLGMSGSLRVVPVGTPPSAHDHLDLVLANESCLRLRDPRRFGSLHWTADDPLDHPLLAHLGPEPLGEAFSAHYLYRRAHARRLAVKAFLMDAKVVVGVGNIYASESLFGAGIHPARAAGRVSKRRYKMLVDEVRAVLAAAIAAGGTTLRDFSNSEGKPGYFSQALRVYGRSGKPCVRCATSIRRQVIAQRATYWCPVCQT